YARGEVGGRESRVVGQRGLRRAVREVAATGHTADNRGDVDDRAALTRQQVGYGGAGQRVRGVDVEVERVGEVAGVGVHQRVGDAAADVVDHDVEAAEGLDRGVGQTGGGVEIAEIGGHDVGPAA